MKKVALAAIATIVMVATLTAQDVKFNTHYCEDNVITPGAYPNPTSCLHFYYCTGEYPNLSTVIGRCNDGLAYDVTAKVCDWISEVTNPAPPCSTN